MNHRSIIKGVFVFFFITGLIFVAISPVSAGCIIEETPTGYSIICDDPLSGEIWGTDQQDIIHILPHASLLYSLTESGENFSEAMITGIYGLQGNDEITNDGDVMELQASATTTAVGVSVTIDGIMEGDGEALSDSSAAAIASATGIDGGTDNDTIANQANISSDAQAVVTATDVTTDITVTIDGNASGEALSDASVTANAAATGIESGSGVDEITNRGDIELLAHSEATGVAVSVEIAGTMEGDAAGASVSDASVTATSTAAGIEGGDGNDTIISDGSQISADVSADAAAVSVGLTVSGSMEGNVDGEALSDGSATAEATATGISGGLGQDTIENWSIIYEDVDASATTVAAALDVAISIEEGGNASGGALSDASATAVSEATGIDGGGDGDTIDNRGDIELWANSDATGVAVSLDVAGTVKGNAEGSPVSDASVTAISTAIGIEGGDGDDTIDNEGLIMLMNGSDDDAIDASATAVGVGLTISGSMEGSAAGEALSDSSATADARAIGIDGGSGIDEINNRWLILGNVDSSATAVGVAVNIGITEEGTASGGALSDASVTANAAATGIDGGADGDSIDNRGNIQLLSASEATGVAVSLDVAGTMKGDAEGSSVSDASVTATSTVTGIDGGAGDDTIENDNDMIMADVDADATAVSVGLSVSGSMEGNVSGEALSDGSATADALAVGIDGGLGQDTIDNWSIIYQDVDAGATTVAAALDVAISIEEGGNASGGALSDASVSAKAVAFGIDGGGDGDTIDNRGAIELLANSDATGVAVSLDVAGTVKGDAEGSPVSDASVTAISTATGIEGGEGNDTIENEGVITLMNGSDDDEIDADATAVSVSLTVSGSMEGNISGEALSDSSATADARALGIGGGSGIDEITNRGSIVGTVDSDATAVGVAVDIGLTKEGDVSGAALSDASVTADAAAIGIDGGGDGDTIDNRGDIELQANSDATGVAVSLDVAGTMKGNAEGSSESDASVTADAIAIGITGGEGDDTIDNEGIYTLVSDAYGDSVAASVTISGSVTKKDVAETDVNGSAVSDASSTAEAVTVGLDGGGGNDTITNTSDLEELRANAESDAVAVSAGVDIAVTMKGASDVDIEGVALSDASATAKAVVAGIDAGEGDDIVVNEGDLLNLETYAKSNSDAVAVEIAGNLTIKGTGTGDVKGEAASDASSTAEAFTVGLDGGDGNDTITNRGNLELLKAEAVSDATSVSASVAVSVPIKGVSFVDVDGASLSNSSATAEATVTGLEGGSGDDTVMSEGDSIKLEAEAEADSFAVSVTIAGTVGGDAKGSALSEAGATADATAAGISGGDGDDILENQATIDATSTSVSEANSVSADVTVQIAGGGECTGSALSDSSATSKAAATGIQGGGGSDEIDNEGDIVTLADADADSLAVSVAIGVGSNGVFGGELESEAASDASSTAEAAAGGITAGTGDDTLENSGTIRSDVYSSATSTSISADVAVQVGSNGTASGAALSDSSATAFAKAVGIDGGSGNDIIFNEGDITLMEQHEWNADADALAVGVTIGFAGAFSGTAGSAISNSNAMSDAGATGIAGGEGDDTIANWAAISADVGSRAEATSASASFAISMQGGSASAASLADASATGVATATGINGGEGVDSIVNNADITMKSRSEAEAEAVSVSFSVAPGGVSATSAMADSSSSALSESTGIQGEGGADDIDNGTNLGDSDVDPSLLKITTDSQSTATANSITVSGSASVGLSEGASLADSSASSEASSIGIDGGLGNDTIDNAIEIEATSLADATANSTNVAVGLSVGAAGSASLGDSSATARANATGIEGGADDDRITNTAAITAGSASENPGPMAQAQADSTTVDVGIAVGYTNREASANSSAFAEANAAGISGGSGDDWIDNSGTITVGPDSLGTGSIASASGTSTAVSVTVALGESLGTSSSDTSSTAVVNLAGISGGTGNDDVYNSGVITVGRYFSDSVEPEEAMATARAASETVSVTIGLGDSLSDASSNASSTANSRSIGIETGAGNDWIENNRIDDDHTGAINAFSSSEAVGLGKTTSVSLSVGASDGSAQSDASSLSTALATGIDSGGDADDIITDSDVMVKARAVSTTLSKAENYNLLSLGSAYQSADANSSSTAEAIARGIDGGTGGDIITAAGNYDISAETLVESTSRSSTATGFAAGKNVQESQSQAGTVSDALAIGIDGGEGSDTITSTAKLTVTTFSNADTTATASSNTGFNIAGSSSGESVSGATSNVTATGIGIRGGLSVLDIDDSDVDVITNEGVINVTTSVTAATNSTSTADSITFIGKAEGTAVSDASATVLAAGTGIDGGADDDTITSNNTITVTTTADASVKSTSNADSYATFGGASSMGVSDASADVLAEAMGISGGTGDDTITSNASIAVDAQSIGSVEATSNVDADVTFGGASSEAASDASVTKKGSATGIDGGDGADIITNNSWLFVNAISAGTVTSESKASSSAFIGSSSSITASAAALEGAVDTKGIIGGSGTDTITNLGRVDSIADATLYVNNSSVATAKSDFIGDAEARASSVSTLQGKASSLGVSGDDGTDVIENEGVVNVRAIANATVKSSTVAIAESFFGSSYTEASSSNFAAGESTAEGITAGAENDGILNTGLVTVEAGGEVRMKSNVYSSDGPASSDARTIALSHASGIDSGADDDTITNTSTVFVKTSPRIVSATRTFGSGGHTDGNVGIVLDAVAMGMTGGDGDDAIDNGGNVLVFIGTPETDSSLSEEVASGATAVTDNNLIGEDPEAIEGKWLRVAGGQNPDFFTQVVAFDPLNGEMTLRDALIYDLSSGATYTLYDYGNKAPDIESVQVTAGGRTQVDASTTATIEATGIEGGDGDDGIVNSGSVTVSASNLIKTVSITFSRDVNSDSDTESTVYATGIAGDGNNDIFAVTEESAGETFTFIDEARTGEDPEAIVGKRIRFTTGESADFFTVVEEFDPETGTFTLLDPLPEGGLSDGDRYALGGGSNSLVNEGEIDAAANSVINASSWSLTFGNADIETNGKAKAVSTGVEGGEYDDFVGNTGRIDTLSTSNVTSIERALVFFGGADQELFFEAVSNSAGMSAGAGNDIIVNGDDESEELAAMDVDSVATAVVNGVTTTFINFRETYNLVDARSVSTAMGLDLGEGENNAYNAGEIDVSAKSTTFATAISNFSLYEETNARANATATAIASGISAEDGGNTVHSSGDIVVTATALADSEAQGSDVIGGSEKDINSAVTEDRDSGSIMFIDESLDEDPEDVVGKYVRFLTGDNQDFTTQVIGFDPGTGTLFLAQQLPGDLKAEVVDEDTGEIITPADEYTIANGRDGESGAFANAFAIGVNLNNGSDTGAIVEIGGTLHVTADAEADSNATAFYNGTKNANATAVAEARGIVTGGGNDSITNTGEIDVSAEITAASNTGVPEEVVLAIGIESGTGNDTIMNSGSIITGVVVNGAEPVAGVGILAGAGNDTVSLYEGTSITGDVDLGTDDDTLYLVGSPLVNGNLLPDGAGLPDDGIDSLFFEGAGFFANSLDGFNRATKYGSGTYRVPNLPTMQWLEVTEGTLETDSDYDFDGDGIFQTTVYSDGTFGKLHVMGSSVLDGGLTVLRGQGAYVNGTTYDIIEATTGITGTFSDVVLPPPTTLLSFDVNQQLDVVEVEANAESFTTVATNRVERAIANYLDRIIPTATGDLSNLIGEFQLLSPSEFSKAFASLSPGLYDNSTRAMYDTTQQYTTTLLKRIHSLQLKSASAVPKASLIAYNGSAASIGRLYVPAQQKQPAYGIWVDGFGQWGDQDKDDGFTGYNYDIHGVTLGIDRMIRDHYLAGISIGYSDTDIDVDRQQGDGDIDTVYGSLYGSYFTKRGYIDAVLSCGNQNYFNRRHVVIGPIVREARSNHDGLLYSAFAEGGYTIDIKAWALQPFASLLYLSMDEEAVAERGADSANLIIDDRETESLVSELGLRVARLYELTSGTLIPEVSVAWNYDFDIDDRTITTAFEGAPTSSFSIDGQCAENNGLTIGTGITLMNKRGLTTSLKYNGEFRNGYGAHGIIGELRYEF